VLKRKEIRMRGRREWSWRSPSVREFSAWRRGLDAIPDRFGLVFDPVGSCLEHHRIRYPCVALVRDLVRMPEPMWHVRPYDPVLGGNITQAARSSLD